MPHGPYRSPTLAEMSWQAFHALAGGARGISYFAYWTPVHVPDAERLRFRDGLIEDGKPTLHYLDATTLNAVLKPVAAELRGFRWIAVADSQGEIGIPLPVGPIAALRGGTLTAGLFAGAGGQLAVLLVNRDYRNPVTATLRLRPGASAPDVFDAYRGTWRRAGGETIALGPGAARLLRWR